MAAAAPQFPPPLPPPFLPDPSVLALLEPANAGALLDAAQTFKTLKDQATRSRVQVTRVQQVQAMVRVSTGGGFGDQPYSSVMASQARTQRTANPPVPLLQRFQTLLFDQFGEIQGLAAMSEQITSATTFVTQNESLIRQSWSIRGVSGSEVNILKNLDDNWVAIQATVAKAGTWDKAVSDLRTLQNTFNDSVNATVQGFLDDNLAGQVNAAVADLKLPAPDQAVVDAAVANLFAGPNFLAQTFQPAVQDALTAFLGEDAAANVLGSMTWLQGGVPKLKGLDTPLSALEQGLKGIAGVITAVTAPAKTALDRIAAQAGSLSAKQVGLAERIEALNTLAADQAATVAKMAGGDLTVVGHFWDNTVAIMRQVAAVTKMVADVVKNLKDAVDSAKSLGDALLGGFTHIGGAGTTAAGALNPLNPNSMRGLIRGLPEDPLLGKALPPPG